MAIESGIRRNFSSENLLETVESGIAVDRTLFDALAGLYPDLVQAIVQEVVVSNVEDAYVEFGSVPKAPQVTFPTRENPFFSVRDFAGGMSYEFIKDVYMNFNVSPKRNSNNVTGNKGLGAKVPGAYADQYTVESICDGEKTVWLVSKNERGVPIFGLVYRGPSQEMSGTKITIPAKVSDFGDNCKFRDAFKHFTQFSPLDWEVDGEIWEGFKHPDSAGVYEAEGTIIRFWPRESLANSYALDFVVGNLPYKYPSHNNVMRYYHVQVPIGSMDLTPARDSIQKDFLSTKKVMKILDSEEFAEAVKSHMNAYCSAKFTTKWDFINNVSSWAIHPTLHYKGQSYNECMKINLSAFPDVDVTCYYKAPYHDTVKILEDHNNAPWAKVFWNDVSRGGKGRVKKYLEDSHRNITTALVFNVPASMGDHLSRALRNMVQKDVLGGRELLSVSELDDTEAKAKAAKSDLYAHYMHTNVHTVTEFLQNHSYYVESNRNNISSENSKRLRILRRLGIPHRCAVIPLSHQSVIEKHSLKPLRELDVKIKEWLQHNEANYVINQWLEHPVSEAMDSRMLKIIMALARQAKTAPELLDLHNSVKKALHGHEGYAEAAEFVSYKVTQSPKIFNLVAKAKLIFMKMPELEMLMHVSYPEQAIIYVEAKLDDLRKK